MRRIVVAIAIAAAARAIVTRRGRGGEAAMRSTPEVQTLLKNTASWNGVPYKDYPAGHPELTVLRMTIPAGAELPWHTHPVPNAAYILSGELPVQDRASGTSATFGAGQVFAESVGAVHRGVAGDKPVEVIITYAGVPGLALSQPTDQKRLSESPLAT